MNDQVKQEKRDMINCLTKTGLLERQISQQELIINLLKDGCEWTEDVYSNQWQERLSVPKEAENAARRSLRGYMNEVDFKFDQDGETLYIWIASVPIPQSK